jgi:hypothetical protein
MACTATAGDGVLEALVHDGARYGIDVSAREPRLGIDALMLSAELGLELAIPRLVGLGAKVDGRTRVAGMTAAYAAAACNHAGCLRALHAAGADLAAAGADLAAAGASADAGLPGMEFLALVPGIPVFLDFEFTS